MRRDGEVALVADLIAIVDVLRAEGAAIEHGLPGGGVAVGAGDGDGVAQSARAVAVIGVCGGVPREGPEGNLLAFARQPVADNAVQACGGVVVDGGAEKDVLVLLRGVVGDVVEVPGVGHAGCVDAVVKGGAATCFGPIMCKNKLEVSSYISTNLGHNLRNVLYALLAYCFPQIFEEVF